MTAPAEFLVVRHRVSHADETAYQTAKHLKLDDWTVAQAIKRTSVDRLAVDDQFVELLRSAKRRPTWKEVHFRIPNPENWYRSFQGEYLLSGERTAAEIDHMAIVPQRHLVYVQAEDFPEASRAALDSLGEVSQKDVANLTIRIADPWLQPDEEHPRVVEKGQRLLDYVESRQIQLLRGLQRGR